MLLQGIHSMGATRKTIKLKSFTITSTVELLQLGLIRKGVRSSSTPLSAYKSIIGHAYGVISERSLTVQIYIVYYSVV